MDSILTSIKKLLGITEKCEDFDADIIMHANSVFMILNQLGVGPPSGFRITDKTAVWNDFVPADNPQYEAVKSYMGIKVRLLFDPPLSATVLDSMTRMVSEFEWRLREAAESEQT